jgi:3-hydroxybutyryl-CoA dehydrogenase
VLQDIVPGAKAGQLKLFTDRTQALDSAWLVMEAIPKILPAKIALLGELNDALPPNIIIATNLSSYTLSEMIERVQHRERGGM